MAINKNAAGMWVCNTNKSGMKRVRRQFKSKVLAEQFEKEYVLRNTPVNSVSLAQLVNRWIEANEPTLTNDKLKIAHAVALLAGLTNP